MRRTGFLHDSRFLLHDTGPGHPECPERIECAYRGVAEAGLLENLIVFGARPAEEIWVHEVHSPDHLARLKEACSCGMTEFDFPDNQICGETYKVALLAAGGVLEAARLVMEGKIDNAFCAVRPPGHHAERDRAMGFCYLNHVAIAARYIQKKWDIGRIGIIDFDVHHGNGTQHIFELDQTVFYYSIHEHPSFAYPGTGRDFERGSGAGTGYTLNSPVLPGQGDRKYREILERDMFPMFSAFRPEVMLVSAGFDAHADDDMSSMNISTEFFSWMMREIVTMSQEYSKGRLISILEGGYSLKRLPELIRNHVSILLGL